MSTLSGSPPGPSHQGLTKSVATLADGRRITFYDEWPRPGGRSVHDERPLPVRTAIPEVRLDPLLDNWVMMAAHRQDRSFLPSIEDCPLCPTRPGHPTEVPAPEYDVVVLDNRYPALDSTEADNPASLPLGPFGPELVARPGVGRCEVVCFTSEHDQSFVDLSPERVATILEVWTDRTLQLGAMPEVQQVFCFENRGEEIGVTLTHPHGQVYGYPFVTARTERLLANVNGYRDRTGANLFDDVVACEVSDGRRLVARNGSWLAFVPFAARWPFEVHLYPVRRVPDLTALDATQRQDFPDIYLDLLRRLDGLFGCPAPYISAWHQSPVHRGRDDFALHLELFTVRRAPGRLKYLAGSESGMDAFANDVMPEQAADRLRQFDGTLI